MEAISVGLSHLTLTMQKWSILSRSVFGDSSVISWEKQVLPEGNSLQLFPYGISCPLERSNFCPDWIRVTKQWTWSKFLSVRRGKLGKKHPIAADCDQLTSLVLCFLGETIEFRKTLMRNYLFQFLTCSWGSSPSTPGLIDTPLELRFRMGPRTAKGVASMPISVVVQTHSA